MPLDSNQMRADRASSERRLGHRLVEKLSETTLFQEYQEAFKVATGLSLSIRPVRSDADRAGGGSERNPFCQLLDETKAGCTNCESMLAALEAAAACAPKSLECFAGLCDSAVPIRVGGEVVAFLHTGQILLHEPNSAEFAALRRQLLAWDTEVDWQALEDAYYQTKVFDREQYEAMLRLLAMFADHLAVVSNSIEIEDQAVEPELIRKAKRYIQSHYGERISLDEAAQAANASTRHFCKVFKSSTGITFTDYLARMRVEKAKHLLQNPHLRVSEIAFETGFESISQFNRSFKRITGHSPTQFREA